MMSKVSAKQDEHPDIERERAVGLMERFSVARHNAKV